MPPLNANVARYHFETASLPPEVFQVARFRGVEEISRLFRYEFELISTDAYVDFASVVNEPATFTLMRGDEAVPVHGLVVDFRQEGRSKDYVAYRAILAPRLWWLSLTYQSRIFQHLTLEEIITKVLQEAGLAPADFQFDLSGSYPALEYVVQYNETDLNFICRLMEKFGVFFFFKHTDSADVLVMTDDKGALSPIDGESTLDYHELEGMAAADVEVVHDFICREQIVTGKVVLKDYNYETPDATLKVESQLNGKMPGTYYEYGQHYKDAGEGQSLAQIRNEEIESRRRVLEGSSNCVGFRAGFTYSLDKHYRQDYNEDYVLLWVSHEGSQRHALGLDALPGEDAEAGVTYGNAFRCIPAGQPFRPERRTPVPQIPGVMVAKVERSAGPYAGVDDQGRYRARMNFDLGEAATADATKPIRMNQPYSGPNYGVHFPNHEATEMIWACVNGDVDRPLALGTVPNPSQASPATAPNKWQSVIRTWGKNELTFDDKQGEENIYMFATKDHTVVVTNDESITVGHDQSTDVGNDQTIHVGHDRTKTVDHDQAETVGHNKSIDVVVNHTEKIGAEKTLTVGGGHTESIGSDMTISVGASLTETVIVNYAETVGVAMQLSVGGSRTKTVGANDSETVGVNKSISVGNNLSETVGKDKSVEISKNLNEKVGGDHHEQVTKEFAVNAKKIQLVAEDQIVFKTGKAEIIMKKNGDIEIQGKKIQIKGSGDVIIKGKKIKEN